MKCVRIAASVLCLLLVGATGSAFAQAISLNANVVGSNVSLTWTAAPGANQYGVQVSVPGIGVSPILSVGNTTAVSVPAPAGSYLVQVFANTGATSNVVTVNVGSTPVQTPQPTNFAAAVDGNAVLFSWSLPTTTGLTGLIVEQLSGPGGAVWDLTIARAVGRKRSKLA